MTVFFTVVILLSITSLVCVAAQDVHTLPAANPVVIPLAQPLAEGWGGGGLFAHDVNADGAMDLVIIGDGGKGWFGPRF